MSDTERAVACFNNGFNCAQALLSTFAPQLGLDKQLALKVAGGFGAGMGYQGETCGAVTGAFMVIGLKYGKSRPEDDKARELTYKLVREFTRKFSERNGSIGCRELLGCDISTSEGMKIIKEKNLFNTFCIKMVEDAIEILEKIMAQDFKEPKT